MARTQLSPLLCDATHGGQLRPWRWLVSVDNPEVPAADRPASLAAAPWVGLGKMRVSWVLIIWITVDTLAEVSPCGMDTA